jgi:NAD(P)-dependent dehydrogenase (short-subunit alcohol dehydrogenase family)
VSWKLKGKIAVVTSGSAGIGFGAARRFAEEGARVFITDFRQAELNKAIAKTGTMSPGFRPRVTNNLRLMPVQD